MAVRHTDTLDLFNNDCCDDVCNVLSFDYDDWQWSVVQAAPKLCWGMEAATATATPRTATTTRGTASLGTALVAATPTTSTTKSTQSAM
jgi:hypothetical protein